MIGLATIVALLMAIALPSAAPDIPLTVIVTDAGTQSLVLIDANTGQERGRLALTPGGILYPREPSRLVVFSRAPVGNESASVVGRDPFRILASIPIGTLCNTFGLGLDEKAFGKRLLRLSPLQSADGRRVSVLCRGRIVTLDLMTGMASTLELPSTSPPVYALPDERALLVSRTEAASDLHFVDLSGPRLLRTEHLGGYLRPGDAVLSADGRLVVLQSDAATDAKQGKPSELLYFDLATTARARTVRLSSAFRDAKFSADGQHVYVSTIGDDRLPRDTPRVLEVVSVADGAVLERITLGKEARWLEDDIGLASQPRLLLDAPGTPLARMLVLDAARVIAVPLPGATWVRVIGDATRNRVFVAAGRHLSEFSLPTFEPVAQVALGADLDVRHADRFVPSDDCRRILWIRGNSIRVVHTDTHTLLPAATIGTAGSKATQLIGEVAMNVLSSSLGHPAHSLSVGNAAVFGTDATRAYALASTGELATIDVATGRVTGHRPGGGRLLATPTLVIAVSPRTVRVIDRATGTTTQALALDTPADGSVVIASSGDRTRLIVGGGSVVHIVDGVTGATVATAKGLGHVRGAGFWE